MYWPCHEDAVKIMLQRMVRANKHRHTSNRDCEDLDGQSQAWQGCIMKTGDRASWEIQ